MRRYRLTNQAQADIEEIGAYIARDNRARARTFVQELRQRCARLPDLPHAARLRPEIAEGVRLLPFGNYVILYTAATNGSVVVDRIVHGARDLPVVVRQGGR